MRKFFTLSALLIAAGCNSSLENFCTEADHPFIQELRMAAHTIERTEAPRRSVASLNKTHPGPHASYDAEEWTSWTKDRLNEIQAVIDDTQKEPEWHVLSHDLMAVADDLMRFQGVLQSHSKKTSGSRYLKRALDKVGTTRAKVCAKANIPPVTIDTGSM